MKKTILLFASVFSFLSCTQLFMDDTLSNSAIDTFDAFWKGVDATWPEFASKHVNWDSLYSVYRPQVNATTDNASLQEILKGLLYNLKDTHTTIYPPNSPAILYYPDFARNFYGIVWVQKNYIAHYSNNKIIGYGLINPEIGYIYISTFENQSNDYSIIDTILKDFGNVKGIIIDIRNNTGGSSSNGITIASHFADQTRTYEYVKFRINGQRNMMSDFAADNISPAETIFQGKVAVLTNRYCYSAAENFILMMKSLPQTIQIGDSTGGGSGTRPLLKELPNGWQYRVSSMLLCDLMKQPITKGIIPEIIVKTTKADSLQGKDSIIERALVELMK